MICHEGVWDFVGNKILLEKCKREYEKHDNENHVNYKSTLT